MNFISINTNKPSTVWDQLSPIYGKNSTLSNDDDVLDFKNQKGQGKIEIMQISQGVQLFRFKMTLNEPLTIQLMSGNSSSSLNFCYCTSGIAGQRFESDEVSEAMNKFKTFIVGYPKGASSYYEFPENQQLHFVLININCGSNQSTEEKCLIKKQINQLLRPHHKQDEFLYKGSYNLKIAEKIRQLESMEETGVVKRLITEGIVKHILALELKQHGEDMAHALNDMGSLRVSEMETIKELTNFIDSNIHLKLNLSLMKSRSGLSPKKLQEGFKLMHGTTVNDYIKNIRLQVAEHLIKTSELNISEIVYTIGLSSRSYFSRIFLEHFDMCPKDYKDQFGEMASA